MIKNAIILAGGIGRKMWPYTDIRNKSMLPVANKPLLSYIINSLREIGCERILVASAYFTDTLKSHFKEQEDVFVLDIEKNVGNSETLMYAWKSNLVEESLVLYGDTYIEKEDLQNLLEMQEGNSVLVKKITDNESGRKIAVKINDSTLESIIGHPRKKGFQYEIVAYKLNSIFVNSYLEFVDYGFDNVQVGMMPSNEKYIESALCAYMNDGNSVEYILAQHPVFNLDYPWDVLCINHYMVEKICNSMKSTKLSESVEIDDTVLLCGHTVVGENSIIGRNVVIKGNLLVGKNSVITNGVVIEGNCIIGDNCIVENYCCLASHTVLGNGVKVKHCAEVDGVIFDYVALGHYMEVQGIIGKNTDIGAGTVFGALRFDDGKTQHDIDGCKITPDEYSNAVFIGDYVRTGVNSVIMPGVKVGTKSIVGANVLLEKDLASGKIIFLKQELVEKEWSSRKYGW